MRALHPARRAVASIAVLGMVLIACGEPPIDVVIPARAGAHVADLAGVIGQADALEARLAGYAAAGVDIVVLTYTTGQASCGEAFRAGQAFVATWEADVALVAVAAPGDFSDADGDRCVGLQPLDDFAVGRGTREQVSEVLWPPLIEQNAWDAVFAEGAEAVHEALAAPEQS